MKTLLKRLISVLVICFTSTLVQAEDAPNKGIDETERLAVFLQSVYDRTLSLNPELAFKLGKLKQFSQWDERSIQKRNEDFRRNWLDLQSLHNDFDYDKLNDEGKLNYRAFEADLKLRIQRYSWRFHISPVNQIVGIHLEIPGLLTKSIKIQTLNDAQAYLSAIKTVGTPIDQFIDLFRQRESKGFLLAKSVVPRLIQAAKSVISGSLEGEGNHNILLADFTQKLKDAGIDKKTSTGLLADFNAAMKNDFIPAYQRLIDTFEQHTKIKQISDNGVWRYPDGENFYQFLLGQFTTTNVTASDVHALGLKEVAHIHDQMNRIREKVGFESDLKEFFTHLKTAPEFYFPNTDEGRTQYLELAHEIVDKAKSRINDVLPMGLEHELVIRRIEPYREKSAPVGFYEAGKPDGSVPGTVYLGMYDMASAATYDLNALLAHEGVPGHHLQLSVMQSQKHIPELRKYYVWWSNTAFTEGWALYAEYLAKEMGLYRDDYAEFGRLAGELWRACRLVVDSGLHFKKWTRQQAIDYLNENTASSVENNTRAIDRYLAVPGQATAFKIGMIKILELRDKAQAALGGDFDIREFHYTILKDGPIPLSLIEEEVDTWISRKRK